MPEAIEPIGEGDARPRRGWGAVARAMQARALRSAAADEATPPGECRTCQNRKYQDRSDDPSVSFQTPTALSPTEAPAAVMAHESEHVRNEQQRARETGREVVAQNVQIHTAVCPECGRVYVAGGTTTTVTRPEASDRGQEAPLNGLDVRA